MNDIKKAIYYMAHFHALSNAAELIRGHQETGFYFLDEEFNDAYLKQTRILSEQLNNRAYKFLNKYYKLGITISTDESCK